MRYPKHTKDVADKVIQAINESDSAALKAIVEAKTDDALSINQALVDIDNQPLMCAMDLMRASIKMGGYYRENGCPAAIYLLEQLDKRILEPYGNSSDPIKHELFHRTRAQIRECFERLPQLQKAVGWDKLVTAYLDFIFTVDFRKPPKQQIFINQIDKKSVLFIAVHASPDQILDMGNHLDNTLTLRSSDDRSPNFEMAALAILCFTLSGKQDEQTNNSKLNCYNLLLLSKDQKPILLGHAYNYANYENIPFAIFNRILESPLKAQLEKFAETRSVAALELAEIYNRARKLAEKEGHPDAPMLLKQAISYYHQALHVEENQLPRKALTALREIHQAIAGGMSLECDDEEMQTVDLAEWLPFLETAAFIAEKSEKPQRKRGLPLLELEVIASEIVTRPERIVVKDILSAPREHKGQEAKGKLSAAIEGEEETFELKEETPEAKAQAQSMLKLLKEAFELKSSASYLPPQQWLQLCHSQPISWLTGERAIQDLIGLNASPACRSQITLSLKLAIINYYFSQHMRNPVKEPGLQANSIVWVVNFLEKQIDTHSPSQQQWVAQHLVVGLIKHKLDHPESFPSLPLQRFADLFSAGRERVFDSLEPHYQRAALEIKAKAQEVRKYVELLQEEEGHKTKFLFRCVHWFLKQKPQPVELVDQVLELLKDKFEVKSSELREAEERFGVAAQAAFEPEGGVRSVAVPGSRLSPQQWLEVYQPRSILRNLTAEQALQYLAMIDVNPTYQSQIPLSLKLAVINFYFSQHMQNPEEEPDRQVNSIAWVVSFLKEQMNTHSPSQQQLVAQELVVGLIKHKLDHPESFPKLPINRFTDLFIAGKQRVFDSLGPRHKLAALDFYLAHYHKLSHINRMPTQTLAVLALSLSQELEKTEFSQFIVRYIEKSSSMSMDDRITVFPTFASRINVEIVLPAFLMVFDKMSDDHQKLFAGYIFSDPSLFNAAAFVAYLPEGNHLLVDALLSAMLNHIRFLANVDYCFEILIKCIETHKVSLKAAGSFTMKFNTEERAIIYDLCRRSVPETKHTAVPDLKTDSRSKESSEHKSMLPDDARLRPATDHEAKQAAVDFDRFRGNYASKEFALGELNLILVKRELSGWEKISERLDLLDGARRHTVFTEYRGWRHFGKPTTITTDIHALYVREQAPIEADYKNILSCLKSSPPKLSGWDAIEKLIANQIARLRVEIGIEETSHIPLFVVGKQRELNQLLALQKEIRMPNFSITLISAIDHTSGLAKESLKLCLEQTSDAQCKVFLEELQSKIIGQADQWKIVGSKVAFWSSQNHPTYDFICKQIAGIDFEWEGDPEKVLRIEHRIMSKVDETLKEASTPENIQAACRKLKEDRLACYPGSGKQLSASN